MEKLGIYIHNPYCLQKCKYCDFMSFARTPEREYYEGLCRQIEFLSQEYNCRENYLVDSIFFGGGTPTLADTAFLEMVLTSVRNNFNVSEDCEITTEANPETVSVTKLQELRAAGFNRISVGVQSFDDEILKSIGRVHNAAKAMEACELIAENFCNFNIDLMIGLPGQTFEKYKSGFEQALSFNPAHLSFYSLQLEEGTKLYDEYRNGFIELPQWSENRKMYAYSVEKLKAEGFYHYEVSNAAKPGSECRHNLKYWHMMPYLGFGNSAHSFINNKRFYFENDKIVNEENSLEDLKGDFIFTELRLTDGFDTEEYRRLFASDFLADYGPALDLLSEEGFLSINKNIVKLTEKGLDNTNPVMERLLNV